MRHLVPGHLASSLLALGLSALAAPAAALLLSGTVVDPAGTPVKDVDLDVEDLATGITLVTPNDNTNRQGYYALEIPAGTYRVLFTPPLGLRLAAHVEPRVELAADLILDLQLAPGIGLAGRITGPDGSGVPGVDIDVIDRTLHVKLPTPGDLSNGLGFYSVVVPAGIYDVEADAPLAGRLASMRVDSLVVGSEDVLLNLHLEAGLVLSGTIRGAGGAPAAGIDLDATDLERGADVPLGNDKTDAAGGYAVVVRPGRYRVGIDAPASTRLVSAVVPELEVSGDRALDVDLVPGFLVEGEVRDPEGGLLEGANLDFIDASSGAIVPTPSDFSNLRGAYAVALPAGTFDLIAYPPAGANYPPDTTLAIQVARDLRLDVRFGEDVPPPPPPPPPPAVLALGAIFPNPSPAAATIPLLVPEGLGPVRITIADAGGRVVRILEGTGAGRSAVAWDGRDRRGLKAPSGVYFVRLEAGGATDMRKLVVFRESL